MASFTIAYEPVVGTMRRLLSFRCAVGSASIADEEDHGVRLSDGSSIVYAQNIKSGNVIWNAERRHVVEREGRVEAQVGAAVWNGDAYDEKELWEYVSAADRAEDARDVCAFTLSMFRSSATDRAEMDSSEDDDKNMCVRVYDKGSGETVCVVDFVRMHVASKGLDEPFSLVMCMRTL